MLARHTLCDHGVLCCVCRCAKRSEHAARPCQNGWTSRNSSLETGRLCLCMKFVTAVCV